MANHKPKEFFHDILNRKHSRLPKTHLYTAGFPCQSFSSLGKRLGTKDPRIAVLKSVIRTIRTRAAKSFILENVARLVTHNRGKTLAKILKQLDDCGYLTSYKVFNTLNFGLPQQRKRVYIVGIRKDIGAPFIFPPEHSIPMPPISAVLSTDKGVRGALPPRSSRHARNMCKRSLLGLKSAGVDPEKDYMLYARFTLYSLHSRFTLYAYANHACMLRMCVYEFICLLTLPLLCALYACFTLACLCCCFTLNYLRRRGCWTSMLRCRTSPCAKR